MVCGGAVGVADGECPCLRVELECPAFGVDDVVVAGAQRAELVEVGASAAVPFGEVMDLALVERHVAAGDDAGAVHGAEGEALRLAGQPAVSSVVELVVAE